MKALVAVKRVPDGKLPLRLKADGAGIDMTGMPMRINPFDETALEAAVQLKEAGLIREIVAISIGPEACQETLRHALALGADRAIRIDSEHSLEPLAVAKLLQIMVEREYPDLVMLGKQSSDNDNAQTGPMLAARLGWPLGAFASTLAFDDKQIVVTREIEGGQETLALTLPAVITADLRLANPRYLKLPQLLQAKKRQIDTLAAATLNCNLECRLEPIKVSAPTPRKPATKVANVTDLLACLHKEGLLHDIVAPPKNTEETAHDGRAVILAEHDGIKLHPAIHRAVTAACRLAHDITLVIAGNATIANAAARIAGVSRVLVADAPHFEHPRTEDLAPLLAHVARQLDATAILAAATPFGKAILPHTAAILDRAMLSDVIEIIVPDIFVRPIHAGEALLTIRSSEPIKILSVRPTAFAPAAVQPAAPIETFTTSASAGQSDWRGTRYSDNLRPALTDARIVIAGGRGLGSVNQFRELIEPLADCLNAAIGATRAAVDAGFIGNDHQVGQTGAIIAPEFYFAIGLSGAAQHLAGMRDSRVIVAINTDPAAPICRQADYVLEDDLFKVIPELLEKLKS